MSASSFLIAAASLVGFSVVNGNAEPVGTMISPGVFIRPSGIFMKSSGIFFKPFGMTFNSFAFAGVPFGFNQSGGFSPAFHSGFDRDRFRRGFFPERRRFGFGIDQAILQERAIRNSGTTIGRQDTIAIGPQSGAPAISPQSVSRHIQEQERPHNPVGGGGAKALGGRGAGHGGGHGGGGGR